MLHGDGGGRSGDEGFGLGDGGRGAGGRGAEAEMKGANNKGAKRAGWERVCRYMCIYIYVSRYIYICIFVCIGVCVRAVKTPRLCGSSELTRKEQRRLNAAANDANDERGGGTRRARAAAGGVVVVDRAVVVAVVAAERERSGRRQCTTGTTVSFILRNKLTPDLLAYFFSTAAVVCSLSDLSSSFVSPFPIHSHSFPIHSFSPSASPPKSPKHFVLFPPDPHPPATLVCCPCNSPQSPLSYSSLQPTHLPPRCSLAPSAAAAAAARPSPLLSSPLVRIHSLQPLTPAHVPVDPRFSNPRRQPPADDQPRAPSDTPSPPPQPSCTASIPALLAVRSPSPLLSRANKPYPHPAHYPVPHIRLDAVFDHFFLFTLNCNNLEA